MYSLRMTETTIQKWGNSLAVRLPKDVASRLALREGSRVQVREGKAGILIRHTPRARKSLHELVHMIRREQLHGEEVWGYTRGREVW